MNFLILLFVIGSGQVAQVLASGFARYGHDEMIGSRDVNKLNEWKKSRKRKCALLLLKKPQVR